MSDGENTDEAERRLFGQDESLIRRKRRRDLKNEFANIGLDDIADIVLKLEDDLAEALNQLRYVKFSDKLTGVASRAGLEDALNDHISNFKRYGTKFCAVYIDLKKFKEINDNYGHAEGDRALKIAANLMKNTFRNKDLVTRVSATEDPEEDIDRNIARVGGDEFVILLAETDEEGAKMAIERLKTTLIEKRTESDDYLYDLINLNYGIKEWGTEDDITSFMEAVDKRMYEEKRGELNNEK
jgi:GGDEF domain-containing protein